MARCEIMWFGLLFQNRIHISSGSYFIYAISASPKECKSSSGHSVLARMPSTSWRKPAIILCLIFYSILMVMCLGYLIDRIQTWDLGVDIVWFSTIHCPRWPRWAMICTFQAVIVPEYKSSTDPFIQALIIGT